jgi:hypothetical protein
MLNRLVIQMCFLNMQYQCNDSLQFCGTCVQTHSLQTVQSSPKVKINACLQHLLRRLKMAACRSNFDYVNLFFHVCHLELNQKFCLLCCSLAIIETFLKCKYPFLGLLFLSNNGCLSP